MWLGMGSWIDRSISVYPDDNNKYEVVGSDVLNEINLILEEN